MISVIIPAYNHEQFIGAAVESVLGQTWTDLELLVIDDGSTDRTGAVVQGYKDSRLTYLYQGNQDAFNTINRGLGLVRGDYVAILNSDDVYAMNRLERLVAMQEQTGAQCLFTDVIPISDSGDEFVDPAFGWNVWHQKNRNFFAQCGDLYTAFLKGNFMVTTSNLFMTAEAVKKVGNFSSLRYLHDYDFIFRMMLAFPDKVHYLENEKLLYYRIHSGNTLGEAAITGREQDRDVIRKYMLARVPDDLQEVMSAGTDRLIELEHELLEVKNALHKPIPGIKQQIAMLTQSISARLTTRKGGN
jgi:glycosyltransferase involved in cell wall biosynthesis